MTYRSQGIKNLSRVSTVSGYTICSVGALNCGDVSDTLISGFSDPPVCKLWKKGLACK